MKIFDDPFKGCFGSRVDVQYSVAQTTHNGPLFSVVLIPHHLYFCASNTFPVGLRTTDVVPVEEKRRPELRLLFAGYFPVGVKKVLSNNR